MEEVASTSVLPSVSVEATVATTASVNVGAVIIDLDNAPPELDQSSSLPELEEEPEIRPPSTARRCRLGWVLLVGLVLTISAILALSLAELGRPIIILPTPSSSPLLGSNIGSNVVSAVADPGTVTSLYVLAAGSLEELYSSGAGLRLRRMVWLIANASAHGQYTPNPPILTKIYYPGTNGTVVIPEDHPINTAPLFDSARRRLQMLAAPAPLKRVLQSSLSTTDYRMVVEILLNELGNSRAQEVQDALQALLSRPSPMPNVSATPVPPVLRTQITQLVGEIIQAWSNVTSLALQGGLGLLDIRSVEASTTATHTPSWTSSQTATPSETASSSETTTQTQTG